MVYRLKKTRKGVTFLASILLVAVLLAACSGGGGNATPEGDLPGSAETEAARPEGAMETPMEVETEASAVVPETGGETPEATTATETETMEAGTTETPTSGGAATGDANSVGLELFAEGFTSPLVMQPAPDDSGRIFVADMIGVVYILDENGQRMEEPFLDLRDRMVELDEGYDERGLLGMAFHPDYASNGRFFVYYSAPLREGAPEGWNHTSHISEFMVMGDNPDQADPDSERILLEVDQPQMNHNGGQIAFGPDGYLYIPLGDGGGADDNGEGHVDDWYEENEGGNAQALDEGNLLGKILRIDVDGEEPYGIPSDNPTIGDLGQTEIYAYGLRNPYRISFDLAGDGALYVGDAGQDLLEEVNVVEAGGNYGWNVKEASNCFSTADPGQPLEECPDTDPNGNPLIDPVIEFQNTATYEEGLGNTVIGGNVYRGSAMTDFSEMYIFGVWSTSFTEANGALFVSEVGSPDAQWEITPLSIDGNENGRLGEFLLSFGTDANDELYILTTSSAGPSGETGKIYRLVPAGEGS